MPDVLNILSERTLAAYDTLKEEAGLLDLGTISGIILTGDDRKGWLQGQVTNDVRRLESGAYRAFCFCSSTGQIQAVVDAWALPDRIVMTTAEETSEAVMRRVEQMVVLEEVEARRATDYRIVSVQGPTATRRLGEMMQLPSLDAGEATYEGATVYCLRSDRTGMGGWDLWLPANGVFRTLFEAFPVIDHAAYGIARLEAGIPFYGADITEKTMPPELGAAFESKHVSYQKGCYMGQEVLMRIHSRGHTNKTWVGLMAEAPLEIGAVVAHPMRADAGVVTSAVNSPDYGQIGAATIRNEFAEDGERVRVITERGEVEAEVRRMPIYR